MANYEGYTYNSEIRKYFSEFAAFYDGENAASLITQKYDDQQWVVLEWLEAIKFINLYSSLGPTFDGKKYILEFAHRARIFWDLVSQGYNTTLCGGGMLWTDQQAPYKNAITNELFIASSIGIPSSNRTRDQRYLNAAIKEYNWLSTSNMTNSQGLSQGLYVDGFHIAGWAGTSSIGTGKCDARDESVYTYNQGVLLSGVRDLWDATGDPKHLNDGYNLMNSVINATGWQSSSTTRWAGLGSNGILQNLCDVDGSCSQDSQNFKGIFFHLLTLFCQPLAMDEDQQKSQNTSVIFMATQAHQVKCNTYKPWILHNSQSPYSPRDSSGVYGGWGNANYTVPAGYTDSPAEAADVWN